tara:strand:- start:10738 stop:11142 length:405 start_codon:yes stop_codon:yes gene_type:complete
LIGELITRIERRGLKLVGIKLISIDVNLAQKHYDAHSDKPFFDGLVDFITSGPVVAMVWSGENAVSIVRSTMGSTDPVESNPGTVRGDLAMSIGQNLIHGSDSEETAEHEINLFFTSNELVDYNRSIDSWTTGS